MTVRVRADCGAAAAARALRAAVLPDTPSFVRLTVRGTALEVRLEATSAASARATLDDLLACLKAAERLAPLRRAGRAQG
ncbi:MAG TPA: KEOPS complex subunit Pcc1 [Thermoplasmata archaeon]|nr:KEOPS complex subunit Pcc1 [Thermoplasmata archaeon]